MLYTEIIVEKHGIEKGLGFRVFKKAEVETNAGDLFLIKSPPPSCIQVPRIKPVQTVKPKNYRKSLAPIDFP